MIFIYLFISAWSLHAVLAVENEGDNPLDWLKNSIPGEPGVDYPIMAAVQETSFTCDGLIFGGYYADPDTQCQQYSVCLQVGGNDIIDLAGHFLVSWNVTTVVIVLSDVSSSLISIKNIIPFQDPIDPSNLYPVNFLCPNGTIFNQELFNCDWW